MLLGQHRAGRSSPGAQERGSLSILYLSLPSGPARATEAAGPSPGEWLTGAVHWPGPRCVLRCPSHGFLIPRASRGSLELDAWQDRAFQAPVVPLGRCGKGSRRPDFSAGPLNGPKHPQDTVSSLPFPGGQLRPAPMHLPPCIDPAPRSMEPWVGREPEFSRLLSSLQHPLQGCSDPGNPRSSA